jgi:hypothetical protein
MMIVSGCGIRSKSNALSIYEVLEEEKIIKAIIKPEVKPAQGVPAEQCTLSFFHLEIQEGRAATTHEN